jgi:hypothetical protein
MFVTLDKMGERYGKLPSEILREATTFDLYAMDLGVRYEYVARQKAEGTYKKPTPKLSVEEMKAILARSKKSGKSRPK